MAKKDRSFSLTKSRKFPTGVVGPDASMKIAFIISSSPAPRQGFPPPKSQPSFVDEQLLSTSSPLVSRNLKIGKKPATSCTYFANTLRLVVFQKLCWPKKVKSLFFWTNTFKPFYSAILLNAIGHAKKPPFVTSFLCL